MGYHRATEEDGVTKGLKAGVFVMLFGALAFAAAGCGGGKKSGGGGAFSRNTQHATRNGNNMGVGAFISSSARATEYPAYSH